MAENENELVRQLLKQLTHIDYIKPGDFPNIDLYMDQVTTFMNTHLSNSKIKPDDKILTKAMINNYAKNDLLPPPVGKKYSREHMIVLIFIYYLKNLLSISDIQSMINPLTERFFDPADNPGHISMEDIYNEVFEAVREQLSTLSADVDAKLEVENHHFENVKNPKDREFLKKFVMICLLSFDIFQKKQLVENIIQSITPEEK